MLYASMFCGNQMVKGSPQKQGMRISLMRTNFVSNKARSQMTGSRSLADKVDAEIKEAIGTKKKAKFWFFYGTEILNT